MYYKNNRYYVKVVHQPTGISAVVEGHNSQDKCWEQAMCMLRERLWTQLRIIPEEKEIAYSFKDGVGWVCPLGCDDINEFKESTCT